MSMDAEGIIIGGLALVWGVILLFARSQVLEFSREGGRGLRDRRVINALVILGVAFLLSAGTVVILTSL